MRDIFRQQILSGALHGLALPHRCWEIDWATGLKYTEGFTRLLPAIGTILALAASLGFLGLALESLPVGTAYAVWTGIGTVGTAVLGIYLFDEPAMLLRFACIGFILLGIIGLTLTA